MSADQVPYADRFPLPDGWRYVMVYAAPRASAKTGEVCSVKCASAYITEHYDDPLAPEDFGFKMLSQRSSREAVVQ